MKSKFLKLVGCAVVALTLGQAGSALADSATTGVVTFTNYSGRGGANGGGEFLFTAQSATSVSSVIRDAVPANTQNFRTFCIEENEYISGGTPYNATIDGTASVAGRAYAGGVGGPNPDPISVATAYIFQNFERDNYKTTNNLGGSIVIGGIASGTTSTLANAVQLAIWSLEQEVTLSVGGHSGLDDLAQSLITDANSGLAGGKTVALTFWRDGGGVQTFNDVRVMNLTTTDASHTLAQSQIVLSNANADVPLPGVAWMGLASFGGLAGARVIRRRRA